MTRESAKAGRFYPSGKQELQDKLGWCYSHNLGPEDGSEPSDPDAVISPHAGYDFSGPCAAHSYLFNDIPDKTVIAGTLHTSQGRVAASDQDFRTPLGTVETDNETVKALEKNSVLQIRNDLHMREHSIEVQLPFLQRMGETEIIPIGISTVDLEDLREVGKAINKAVEDYLFVVSTDFTHAGPRYGQTPPKGIDLAEFVDRQDRKAFEAIRELGPAGFLEKVREEQVSMCGKGATVLMLETVEPGEVEVRQHYSTLDIRNADNAVGYASIALK